MKTASDSDTVATLLRVVADLLRGDRHSRRTISETTGKSLPTADRWIDQIERTLPNTRRVREGKTTWLVHDGRRVPSASAAAGACVAASLGSIFEGSSHERNLKDARDYILQERGEAFADLERKFVLAPRGGESALPEAGANLDKIFQALMDNARLRFEYTHNNRESERITTEPLSLVIYDHQFYVLAKKGEGFYPYRFARMTGIEQLDETFTYPLKGEYDPRSILAQSFGIHIYGMGAIEEIEVILSADWANYALTHRWHPTQRATRLQGGKVRLTLQARPCRELQTWLMGFGEHAYVVRPEHLREAVADRLARAAAMYDGPVRKADGPAIAKARQRRAPQRGKAK